MSNNNRNDEQNKYESLEHAICEELRAAGAKGKRYEELRWGFSATVENYVYDVALGELFDQGVIVEAPDDAGRAVLAEFARAAMGPSGKKAPAEAEQQPIDALPVLAALQLAGDEGASVEDLQREIEASGSGRLALGVVFTIAMQLVDAGKARREGSAEAEARFRLVVDPPAEVLERRTRVVQQLAQDVVHLLGRAEDALGGTVLLSEILAAGGTRGDIDALVAVGVVVVSESHIQVGSVGLSLSADSNAAAMKSEEQAAKADPSFELHLDAFAEILRLGSAALAARTVESKAVSGDVLLHIAPDSSPGPVLDDRSGFERAAAEKAERERARADKLEQTLTLMRDNMRRAELNPEWFCAPPPPQKPPEDVVEYKERRVVDHAEKGAILDEILVLERQMASKKAEFAILKSEHRAAIEELEKEIQELKSASESNARTVVIPARRERDWNVGVLRILAIADGRVLEENPLPKGEQRRIDGTDAPPWIIEHAGAPPASAEAVERFKAQVTDGATGALATAPPGTPPSIIVDLTTLSDLERDIHAAIAAKNCWVSVVDVPAAVQAKTGKPVGPSIAAKMEAAAGSLAERGILVKDGDGFRVLGAPSAPAALTKTPKERVWDVLGPEFTIIGELKRRAGVADEEFKAAIEELKRGGKIASEGRGMGTKYKRAGASKQPEARS